MTTRTFSLRAGDELPGLTLPWQYESSQNTFTDLDLSSGYTFSLLLVDTDGVTQLTKTTGITGTSSGCTVAWAVDDLDLDTGTYTMWLTATETATSKQRTYSPRQPPQITIT